MKTIQLAAVKKTVSGAAANTGVRLPVPTGSRKGKGVLHRKGLDKRGVTGRRGDEGCEVPETTEKRHYRSLCLPLNATVWSFVQRLNERDLLKLAYFVN